MSDELRDELLKAIEQVTEHEPDSHNFISPSKAVDAILPIIARERAAAWQTGHGDPECDEWVIEGMCAQYHPNPYRAAGTETPDAETS